METQSRHYADWKAPSEDRSLIIWPKPADLLRDAAANQKLLSLADYVLVQGIPLSQLRQRMREFIGHDHSQPLIATGHQTELHHPGVWVKNILIQLIADKVGGQSFHFAIDTDSPKHLTLRWPGTTEPLSDDANLTSAAWSGLLDPPTPRHLDSISSKLEVSAKTWNFQPMLPELLQSLRRLSLVSLSLSSMLANAMHELDWSLGLRQHVLLSSPIWVCEPHLVFAHDLIANAGIVASRYNAALADYRKEQGITTNSRPMPDLFVSEEAIEIPFWLDDLHTGKRTRPSVFKSDRGWVLELISGDEFIFDPQIDGWQAAQQLRVWLNKTRHRITPRAMTNMLFLRLLLADQFIHGIGGGRYDQVTDRFIQSHYGIQPPAFGVTTATLFFPSAAGRSRQCIPCVRQEGHRLRHDLLGSRKRELVDQIAALPRRSPQRTARFFEMHKELASVAVDNDVLKRWSQRLRETQDREKQEETLFDRELFYGIQSRDRLAAMIEKYRAEFLAG